MYLSLFLTPSVILNLIQDDACDFPRPILYISQRIDLFGPPKAHPLPRAGCGYMVPGLF